MPYNAPSASHYGNAVSEINVHAPANNWNVSIILVVVMLGALTVAIAEATSVTAKAVPLGVLNSAVVWLNNGSMSRLVDELDNCVHNILAIVPFLYSATGARFAKTVLAI